MNEINEKNSINTAKPTNTTKDINTLNSSNEEELERLFEKRLYREEIFDGVVLHVVKDTVELPNGKPSTREIILHNGAVCIVPITENNEIIMERQFRYPFNEVIWEIPAGKLDDGETDPKAAAARELKEETGYTADDITLIGEYYGSPALLGERIYMYMAKGLTPGERSLDDNEFLDVVKVPFDTVVKMIKENKIPDGKTQTAVLRAMLLK
jgi:ADP-ribose pyrophosphatase